MKPDLNLLAVLDALCRTGSVSRAAQALALSQPAVSHALARLRRATGDALFTRSGRGLVPTPRALVLAGRAAALVAESRALLAPEHHNPSRDSLLVRVASTDFANLTLLPALLSALRRISPGTVIEAQVVGQRTLRQLAEGEIELSFWGVAPPEPPFCHRPLFRDHFVAVLAADHPALGQSGLLKLDGYLRSAHAVVSFGHPGQSPVDAALAAFGKARRVGLVSPSFAANLAVAAASDLIVTLPARLAQGLPAGLCVHPLPFATPVIDYGLIWHDRTSLSPGLSWLRDLIATVAAADAPVSSPTGQSAPA
ncbi:LysR family transcriptional regulator [Tabrizicola sp.]|uniref:LysR family transcriptional regulator n=1 Tax=Tabrizicola sp. TaxID=2005166 RepID=UPI0035B0C69B